MEQQQAINTIKNALDISVKAGVFATLNDVALIIEAYNTVYGLLPAEAPIVADKEKK